MESRGGAMTSRVSSCSAHVPVVPAGGVPLRGAIRCALILGCSLLIAGSVGILGGCGVLDRSGEADKPSGAPPVVTVPPNVSVEPTITAPTVPQVPTPEPAPPAPTPPVATDPPPPTALPAQPSDNTARSWWYTRNSDHRVVSVAGGAVELLATYGGRYVGPDASKVYLTFDEGYEIGYTDDILDALARNGVRATFFVTETFIRANGDLVRRMVNEGHVVGNHSSTHPSMPTLAGDETAFARELNETAEAFTEATGHTMARIFRPPAGTYSPLSLWRTQQMGYESIFWGFAHRDWIVDDQPPVEVTVERILTGSHPGAIFLLHGVSSSDTFALDAAIAGLRAQGYSFGVLNR